MNKTNSKQTDRNSRRRLLGALTVGAASAKLPDLWVKPVVESALLPAHAVASNVVLRSGGGSGAIVSGGIFRLLDGVVPTAHAVGNAFPGCASFEWTVNADGTAWQPESLRLVLLAFKCPLESHLYQVLANLPMVPAGGNKYEAVGDGEWNVVLEMSDPLVGPGQQFGVCNVKLYNAFFVIRGESCVADHPDIDSCSGASCN